MKTTYIYIVIALLVVGVAIYMFLNPYNELKDSEVEMGELDLGLAENNEGNVDDTIGGVGLREQQKLDINASRESIGLPPVQMWSLYNLNGDGLTFIERRRQQGLGRLFTKPKLNNGKLESEQDDLASEIDSLIEDYS